MKINLQELKITNISHSSGVFSGENMQFDWKYGKKVHEGFGTISGNKNKSSNNSHVIQKTCGDDQHY